MKKKIIAASLLLMTPSLLVTSCATGTTKTSLELQAFQKKSFEASKSVAFASVVSVFQDLKMVLISPRALIRTLSFILDLFMIC